MARYLIDFIYKYDCGCVSKPSPAPPKFCAIHWEWMKLRIMQVPRKIGPSPEPLPPPEIPYHQVPPAEMGTWMGISRTNEYKPLDGSAGLSLEALRRFAASYPFDY